MFKRKANILVIKLIQITLKYSEYQELKDENFDLKSKLSNLRQSNSQLNKFLKETKDEYDEKSLIVFEQQNEIASLKYEIKKNMQSK